MPCLSTAQSFILDQAGYLQETVEALTEAEVSVAFRKTVSNAVATAACHSTARFGDKRSLGICKRTVNQLATCDNQFACAHLRPSIVPVARIAELSPT